MKDLFRNRKGQAIPVLGIIFALLIFIVLWFMFFGEQISYWSNSMIEQNDLTGVEAFLMAYMNLWVLIGSILGVLAAMYFGTGDG